MARSARARVRLFASGAALMVGSGVLSRGSRPSGPEVRLFRAVNAGPDVLRRPNWALMLGGTLGAVPSAGAVAWRAGHPRLAARLVTGGTAAYVFAKFVKPYVGRERPGMLLADVTFRDEIGGDRGWLSGHAAVSTSLALIAGPALPPRARAWAYAWAGAVCLGRIYAGAHFPLDVAGGVGLGLMIAALTEPASP